MKKRYDPGPEHRMCVEIMRFARLNEPRYPCLKWLFHLPMEGRRNPWLAKEIGIIAGPSDYLLPVPTARFNGLWLEVKTKGNKPTEAQERWLEGMRSLGFQAHWIDTLQSAFSILETYAREATEYQKRKDQ